MQGLAGGAWKLGLERPRDSGICGLALWDGWLLGLIWFGLGCGGGSHAGMAGGFGLGTWRDWCDS